MTYCSVIVPTLNRLADLQVCLGSLRSQADIGSDWEILIVDNGSTDGTSEWSAQQIGGSRPLVRYVREHVPGLLSGRHRGAFEAEGDILSFVDDDIEASPHWLQSVVMAFEQTGSRIVGGPCLAHYECPPPDWMDEFWTGTPYGGISCSWLSLIDLGSARLVISPRFVWGLNFSIRRKALVELGGFHPDCMPDALQKFQGDGESGLSIRAEVLGWKAIFEPGAKVKHRVKSGRMTIEYFEKRAFYQGVCNSYTSVRRLHGLYGQPRRSIVRGVARRLGALSGYVQSKVTKQSNVPVLSEARRRVQAAYQQGYSFHQAAVRQEPSVREWALRADYWEYALPHT